jgi:hypothetical protein
VGECPEFQIEGWPASGPLRIQLDLVLEDARFGMTYVAPPESLHRLDGDTVAYRPADPDLVLTADAALTWSNLPSLFLTFLVPRGISRIKVVWTAEALTPDRRWVCARSERKEFFLVQ